MDGETLGSGRAVTLGYECYGVGCAVSCRARREAPWPYPGLWQKSQGILFAYLR